jgi:ribosomal protein S17E
MMTRSHPMVHDVLRLLQYVSMVEKAVLVERVYGKEEQQLYQQQYRLSLTLLFQLRAKNVDASSSLEAKKIVNMVNEYINLLPKKIRSKPKSEKL